MQTSYIKKVTTNLLISLGKILAKLPLSFILKFGSFLGWLTWVIPNKRKKIAVRNIALCFPELTSTEQHKLARQNLISTGIGFAEMLIAFWSRTDKFIDKFEIEGLDIVTQAQLEKHGCILLSCHLHPVELALRAINTSLDEPVLILGRQHNNKVYEAHVDAARRLHCEKTIDKKDIRSMLKTFKAKRSIFYGPDQNFSYQCEYIDFFKQPAATVLAPVKIAKASKAIVVPWFCFRHRNGWKIQFLGPLDYFHTDDITTSLTKMNQLFESQIRQHPEQYLWVHRRFKNHPKGRNYLYNDI